MLDKLISFLVGLLVLSIMTLVVLALAVTFTGAQMFFGFMALALGFACYTLGCVIRDVDNHKNDKED